MCHSPVQLMMVHNPDYQAQIAFHDAWVVVVVVVVVDVHVRDGCDDAH